MLFKSKSKQFSNLEYQGNFLYIQIEPKVLVRARSVRNPRSASMRSASMVQFMICPFVISHRSYLVMASKHTSPERMDTGCLFHSSFSSNLPYSPVVDYSGKVRPVITIGGKGSNEGELSSPLGVAVDFTTDNVYVADRCNNRVQVFNSNGMFLFQFGRTKMRHPMYIFIDKEKVLVSQNKTGRILVYDLDGNYIKRLGSPGDDTGEFLNPHGIAVHPCNDNIYICDCGNNRIQLFSNSIFTSEFGFDILEYPVDIQLTETTIFVLLACQKPSLYAFDYNLNLVENHATLTISNYINSPRSFVIDGAGNFIISDYETDRIYIFDQLGNLIQTLCGYTRKPRGVCLDSRGRIIFCSNNNVHIF